MAGYLTWKVAGTYNMMMIFSFGIQDADELAWDFGPALSCTCITGLFY